MGYKKQGSDGWNPYLAGALVGVLALLSAYATTVWLGKTSYLGASTTFVRGAGVIDWQFMLVLGIFAGSLIASATDKSFKLESVPPAWEKRFGPSVGKRAVGAFLGGIVAMMGARLADGCPSGHGLSGMMQLSVSAFVALTMFFAVGIIVAAFIYKRRS
jgi:uncharacterized membrane protein YedE/YeeE